MDAAQSLIPSITLLVLLVGSFAFKVTRDAVGKFFAGMVQDHFDTKLEELRSSLRKSEEQFRLELQAKEHHLASLITTTLSRQSTRENALDARRLLAVERLYLAKARVDRFKGASMWLSTLNYEVALKRSATEPKLQQLFATFSQTIPSMEDLRKDHPVDAERPFLSPVVWAIYSAYQVIILVGYMQLKGLETGFGNGKEMVDHSHLQKLLAAALPNLSIEQIKKYAPASYYSLLDPLEQKLNAVVSDMLEGREADANSLKRASEVVQAANAFQFSMQASPAVADDLKSPTVL